MISVVVSTYNGEKFLREQLDSIQMQTRKPDEVIISDDCSTDCTPKMVEEYIKDRNLNNWKIFVNEHNLGWQKNFMKATKKAKGDYIFFADQDDIWMPNKIEKMLDIMQKEDTISVLASNYASFYMEGAVDKAKNDEKMSNNGKVEKYKFDSSFLYVKRPGCTYCVKKSFFDKVVSYWFEECPHDALVWCFACILGELYVYQEPLIHFRRHTSNASSIEKTDISKKRNDAIYYMTMLKKVKKMLIKEKIKLEGYKRNKIKRIERFCGYRLKFLVDRNWLLGVRLVGYLDCYYALKTFLADWFVVMFQVEIKR